MRFVLLVWIVTAAFAGCKWTMVIWPGDPVLSPCDPVSNLYWKGNHYIERDFVKQDGTLDYLRWFKARKVQTSKCDPVTGKRRLESRGRPDSVPRTKRDELPPFQPTGDQPARRKAKGDPGTDKPNP